MKLSLIGKSATVQKTRIIFLSFKDKRISSFEFIYVYLKRLTDQNIFSS